MTVQSIYENMLKNPKNKIRTQIKQPTPFDNGGNVNIQTKKDDEQESFLRNIDERIERKKNLSGNIVEQTSLEKISKLEEKVKELEGLMTIMMKQQIKLMEK
jgi:hypothetical protein